MSNVQTRPLLNEISLLSLDASVIDLSLSMFNWPTFRQTKLDLGRVAGRRIRFQDGKIFR
jgi:hypothetical protein